MKFLDLTFPTPEENLACDEALLDACEEGLGDETLRFWESERYFVVLGYSNKIRSEVEVDACRREGIPILRRPSGGGTVLQGPGCLNFALVLKTEGRPFLNNITRTNAFVLECHRRALEPLVGPEIRLEGFTDLAVRTWKFSGNAQRRKRRFTLFHGTFLLNFDIPLIGRFLKMPSQEPVYRRGRPHTEFLANLDIPNETLKEALRRAWNARESIDAVPHAAVERLVRERYSRDEWNLKF